MSLHLIESQKLANAIPRKRGGTVASVVIHVVLIFGAVTVATASPVVQKDRVEQPTVYVTPTPVTPPPLQHPVTPSASTSPSEALNAPPPAFDVPIPVAPIDMSNLVMGDRNDPGTSPTTFGVDYAVRPNRGTGSVPGNGVFDAPQVEKPVVALAGMRAPRYPEALRAAGVQDTVVATFVVDTIGRVENTSIEITNAPHALFSASVREALLVAKYQPAEAGGHRVRQRVVQAFVFSIGR